MTISGPHDSAPPLGHIAEWESSAVDYVAGLLSESERTIIDAHLASCPACRDAVDDQVAVLSALARAPMLASPDSVETAVMAAFAGLHAETQAVRTAAEPTGTSWWSRLAGTLDRPATRRLAPALAVGLIAVVSLVGLARLDRDDLAMRSAGVTTTAAASMVEAYSADDAGDSAARDGSSAGSGAGPDTSTTVSAAGTVAETSPGPDAEPSETTLAPADTTASMLTQTTAPAGEQTGEVTPPQGAAETQVVYVTVSTGESTAAARDLVEWTTGLTPLPSDVWLGGPTYAALMPPEGLEVMTGELAAQGVGLSVSTSPPPGTSARADAIADAEVTTIGSASTDKDPTGGSAGPGASAEDLMLVVMIAR